MNYWWVYQGQSFGRARAGGYLWAPDKTTVGGTPYYYWTNVMRVEIGDLIFSHVGGQIVAVCTPVGAPYPARAPDTRDAGWAQTGYRVDVEFRALETPVPFAAAQRAVIEAAGVGESPFASNGRPNQGYLFRLSDAAGVRLSELVLSESGPSQAGPPGAATPPASTAAQATITVRLGQAAFRRRLDLHWQERCAVTGLEVRDLLRASHIKRWSDASHGERLDPFNGLLLSVAYDAAFDRGLITFSDDGQVVLSKWLNADHSTRAGIDPKACIAGLQPAHRAYLSHHRKHYFKG